VREALKAVAHGIATLLVLPWLASFAVRRVLFGADRALEGSSQALSLLPGIAGEYLRRAFLARVLAECDRTATIGFGTILSKTGARLGAHVYLGPRCHLGLVHIERDVLVGSGVHVPSGAATHGTDDLDRPIREQAGLRKVVRIGEGAWIGSAAVVLADVGRHAVVGAGAVVTRPVPEYAVAVGVPARVVRDRRTAPAKA
jgi:acetyltransferase-like isoleucine patch superfamily enzyme